jgi:hypothetical protein
LIVVVLQGRGFSPDNKNHLWIGDGYTEHGDPTEAASIAAKIVGTYRHSRSKQQP